MPIFDHVSIGVRNIEAARRFYDAAWRLWASLASMKVPTTPPTDETARMISAFIRVVKAGARIRKSTLPSRPLHGTPWRSSIAGGIDAGGSDDGAPAIRDEYAEDYFAAFLKDPDGQRIEAVCHTRQT